MLMIIHRMSDVDPFYKEVFYLEQALVAKLFAVLQWCVICHLCLLNMSHRGLTACPRAVRRVHVSEGEGEWGGGRDHVPGGQLRGGGAGRGWQRPEAECLGRAGDQEVGEAAGGARHGVVDGHGHGDSPPADQRGKWVDINIAHLYIFRFGPGDAGREDWYWPSWAY